MRKSKWLYSLLALFVVFLSLSSLTGEYENEEDLIKAANKHFSKGEYDECVTLFSQLVSNHPQNPNYNFKYGTCLLYTSEDKEQAIKFLKFATSKSDVESEAYFYYGRALHLNYQFGMAKGQYQKFKVKIGAKKAVKYEVSNLIRQCSTAEKMIGDLQQINVVNKKKVNKSEFFRSYRLGSMKRNIIIKPEDFQTKEDKKSGEYSLIVHNPMNEVIYVSSYNKKNGMGGKDLYKIQKMPDGTFSEPINLGPEINTEYDEDYPYLHPNGKVLYFASKGHNSIGGYDIFRSELDTLLNLWGPAVNVGFAVNSPDDDLLYVSDLDENIAYFASSRENRQGEITVYKILPNSNEDPVVIVKGQIHIKGANQHKAKVTIYDEAGEEVGVYTSQQLSGSFTMTLPESSTYTVGISAPGKGESKVKLDIPAKSQSDMIAKRFEIEGDKVRTVDTPEMLTGKNAREKILAESAKLKVNQTKDVEFNTKMAKKPKVKKKKEQIETVEPVEGPATEKESEINLIADAETELESIKSEKEKVKKEIDGAYFVAQKKKIKTNLLKDEVEELSENLNDAYSQEEKTKIRGEIENKQQELIENVAEATASLKHAQNKEKELKIKEKEEESATQYLEAVKNAEKSNNSLKSITALENSRDQLDKIQEEIKTLKENDGSAEQAAKIDAAQKNVADKELIYNTAVNDIADIKAEQVSLKEQSESTRNKALKEELNLQVTELDEELKSKLVEKNVAESGLKEAKSEYNVLKSSNDVLEEIASESEDASLVAMSETQKAKIQKDVESVKVDQPKVEAVEETKPVEEEETVSIEQVQEEMVQLEKDGKVAPKDEYGAEIAKAELRQQELKSIREEKELLEISKQGAQSQRQKESIQEKIDGLNTQEEEAIADIRQYVNQAKEKQKDLSSEELATSQSNTENLNQLNEELVVIEKQKEEEKVSLLESPSEVEPSIEEGNPTEEETIVENTPNEIENTAVNEEEEIFNNLDLENTSEKELSNLLAKKSGITNENSKTPESKEAIKLKENSVEKKKESAQLFKESVAEQDEDKSKKLEENAYASLFEASELEGEANDKEFESKRENIEKEVFSSTDPSYSNLKEELKSTNDIWVKAKVKREQANKEKNKEEKVKLINEASKLEADALTAQSKLGSNLETLKSNQSEETLITNVETPKSTDPKEELKEQENLTVQNDKPVINSTNKVQVANDSYGVERDDEFAYGPSPIAKNKIKEGKQLENKAAQLYYQSEELKQQAENNPDDAKKLLKKAEKALKEGREIQEEAHAKYKEANEAEINFNKGEIEFALENDDIVNKDTAKVIVKSVEDLYSKAQEKRKEAKKQKDDKQANQLLNEAYNMELEAITKQNMVISGEIDGEEESDLDEIVVAVKKEPKNEYAKKASELRAQADLETDPVKKQELFELARKNGLAGNTDRTNRMKAEITADKVTYESNKNIVITSREQSHNNTPAEKAYKLEREADSLFKIAELSRIKAENEKDVIKQLNLIEETKDLMTEAKEVQAKSIAKYQESKSAPDEPNFIASFRNDSTKEEVAALDIVPIQKEPIEQVEIAQADTPENESIDDVIDEPADEVESTQQIEDENVVNTPEIVETTDQPEVEQNPIAEEQPDNDSPQEETIVDNTPEKTVPTAKESYEDLTSQAKEIEMQEVARVERIEHLKSQSSLNKSKSEELLSTVDAMENEEEIMATISKANSLRDLAEQQEVEAANEEIILKNNIAEGRAMRKEADLILSTVDSEQKENILAEAENTSPELKKIDEFLNEPTTLPEEKVIFSDEKVLDQGGGVIAEAEPETEVVQNTLDPVDLPASLEGATILGEGNTEAQMVEDDFTMNSGKTYTSSDQIPIDPDMPKGLVYQVQVGAFRNKIDPSIFNGLNPLVGEQTPTGIIRYKVGYFRGFKSANMAKGRIRNLGFRDAFVVVFYNGKRISIEEAAQVIENADESEKFVHENLVQDEVQKLKSIGIREDEGDIDPLDVSNSLVVNNPVNNTNPTVNATVNATVQDNGLNNDLLSVGGVFYTVQVGVYRSPKVSSDLQGVSPLYTEKLNNGLLRYSTGVYRDYVSADNRKVNVRQQGIPDAFVIAYNGQQKISTGAAKELQGNDANQSTDNSSESSSEDATTNEVVFMVQVGAYRSPIVPENTPVFKELTAYPISNIETSSGLLIYMAGNYKTKQEADALRQTVIAAGGLDCFVVAIQNGKRIPMKLALELTSN